MHTSATDTVPLTEIQLVFDGREKGDGFGINGTAA